MSVAVDVDAVRSSAVLVWRGLTDAQRSALRRAAPAWGVTLAARGHARTIAALYHHGLVHRDAGPSGLTTIGKLVREVGIDSEAVQAKRRYAKRLRAENVVRP